MTSCGRSRFSVLQSILIAGMLFSASQLNALTISCPSDASIVEKQAAKEVRRYIFLRTGTAPQVRIADKYANLPSGDVIVVAANGRSIVSELKAEYENVDAPSSDHRMGYIIKSIRKVSPPFAEDRSLSGDIEAVAALINDGVFFSYAEPILPSLNA